MKDIHEVLRQKQAQYAQLSKQIEALQAAADKLREVAPLLSELEEDGAALVLNDAEEAPRAVAARAAAGAAPAAKAPGRATTPRWP
jgi:uncharacterized protein YlxW (UPF0749 family)